MLTNIIIWAVAILGFLFFCGIVIARLYRRSSKELAFVRTGLGGEKVILDGGCIKLPVFQDIVAVNMRTLRLQVDRKNEEGLITADRMRVDVTAEFYVRVKPDQEAIAKAAQTLGNRTLEPETLKELLQGKFVDSLRSVAAGLSMEQLHERRSEFVQSVQASVSEDLLKNGLELESVSLTALDQTQRQFFKEDNAFDAQGLAKLTSITEAKREERNRIEQDTRIQIETKNLEAEQRSLEIRKNEEFASMSQKQLIATMQAEQEAIIAREQAERRRESEEARIESARKVRESEIESQRSVEEAEITRKRSIDIRGQEASILVAQKSQEQSKAEAEAAIARAERVKQEENVNTVRETVVAERAKEIRLIKARENAEQEAISIRIAAEAEKQAAADRAEAFLTEARANAERIRIQAEADEKRFEVEAYGEKAINEAKNLLSEAIISFELRKVIAEAAPRILEAMVKPAEKIDSIRIIQANGLGIGGGQGNGSGANGGGQGGGLPNQLTEALLSYRMQSPVIDKLLAEIGLDPSSADSLTASLNEAVAPRPAPAPRSPRAT
jgi:uncharacterized membrane protein YqiK